MKEKSILIVDDDAETRTMYAEIFRKYGFRVQTAIDGLEGIAIATKHHPDIIFTGIVMPRMDGFCMMDALREDDVTKEIPVVMNSHLGRSDDRQKAKARGAKDFIIRELVAPSEVVDRISALLSKGDDYVIEPDVYARDAERLARALQTESGLLQCPQGQKMLMRVELTNPKKREGRVTFIYE